MESFLEDLKLQVQCSLCKETMVEPKLLQCFHTFCKTCIKRNTQLDGEVNIFKCPQCESSTELQELNDVEDLEISPIHSRILQVLSFVENQKVCSVSASHSDATCHCLDCDRSLCDECLSNHSIFTKDHKVVSLSQMTKDDIEKMLKKESPCKIHAKQDVEWHCEDCNELICMLCLRDQHQINKHKMTSLQEFSTAKKDSLSKNLQEIEKMSANEKEKKQQEQIALDIKRDAKTAQEQVKKLTKKLVKNIIDHEQELLKEIQKSMTQADRNLRIIRHTSAAQEYIKYFIQNGTASEIIDLRSDAKCSQTFSYGAFEKDLGGMRFHPNEELCEKVHTGIGIIQSYKRADPNNSSLKADPNNSLLKADPNNSLLKADPNNSSVKADPNNSLLKVVEANKCEAMKDELLIVTLRTYKGKPCDQPSLDDVAIHITPENDVKVGEKQVSADGQIKVPFTPRVPGQLTAEVQVHGTPVSNSPLVIDVKPQRIKEITANSRLKNTLNTGSTHFRGIAVSKSNTKIAVADGSKYCIRVFNMDGNILLSYGSEGSGRLQYPEGLAFLNETDLVIADSNNHRVCILDTTSGMLVRAFGCQGNMNGQFVFPYGVHVDDDSNIIVCDRDNHRIQVFTSNGDYLYQFTIPGQGRCPFDVVTHNRLFYVSDESVVHVIEMNYNQSPSTVTTIGGEDYTEGRLQDSCGLTIDIDGNLLVCDFKSKKVYKFTLDGRYVGETNELGYEPRFIAALNDGQIICSSYDDKGVHFLDSFQHVILDLSLL